MQQYWSIISINWSTIKSVIITTMQSVVRGLINYAELLLSSAGLQIRLKLFLSSPHKWTASNDIWRDYAQISATVWNCDVVCSLVLISAWLIHWFGSCFWTARYGISSAHFISNLLWQIDEILNDIMAKWEVSKTNRNTLGNYGRHSC